MNDLDVILATVEELQEYMHRKRANGRAAVARRIRKLRSDLWVLEFDTHALVGKYLPRTCRGLDMSV